MKTRVTFVEGRLFLQVILFNKSIVLEGGGVKGLKNICFEMTRKFKIFDGTLN